MCQCFDDRFWLSFVIRFLRLRNYISLRLYFIYCYQEKKISFLQEMDAYNNSIILKNSSQNCSGANGACFWYDRINYHPMFMLASIICIVVNIVVICVLVKMKRRTQTNLHLIVLAISDAFIGVAILWIFSIFYFWNPCTHENEFKRQYNRSDVHWIIQHNLNKSITCHIIVARAFSVSTVKNAIKSKRKTKRRVLLELFIASIFYSIVAASLYLVATKGDRFARSFFIIHAAVAFTVAALAVYTLVKLKRQVLIIPTITDRLGSETIDDFRKLVVIVALVFGCSQLGSAVMWFFEDVHKFHKFDLGRYMQHLTWNYLINLLNSISNFFIYVVASTKFRSMFLNLCKRPVGSS